MTTRYEIRIPICGYEDHYFERIDISRFDDLGKAQEELAYLTRIANYKDHGQAYFKETFGMDAYIGSLPDTDTKGKSVQDSHNMPKLYRITEEEITPE